MVHSINDLHIRHNFLFLIFSNIPADKKASYFKAFISNQSQTLRKCSYSLSLFFTRQQTIKAFLNWKFFFKSFKTTHLLIRIKPYLVNYNKFVIHKIFFTQIFIETI